VSLARRCYETYAVLAHRAGRTAGSESAHAVAQRCGGTGGYAWRRVGVPCANRREFRHTPRGQRLDSRPAAPNEVPYDLAGFAPEVTPTHDFLTPSPRTFIDPTVAINGWRLKIDGLVDRPMELTYEQLTALPVTEGFYTLMCISNEIGGELWGNAHWRGVKLTRPAVASRSAYRCVEGRVFGG